MVPYVAERGRSFHGAMQYYLHDKGAASSARVDWTHTHQLPTENPATATKVMAWTAMHAAALKTRAGIGGGAAKSPPVYSYSLSWAPGEAPDKAHMLEQAMATLALLGLEEHEAVMVAHNDRPHVHVHVVCNLIHPESGRMEAPRCDHLTLSRWAQGYEEQHSEPGAPLPCPARVENNRERAERKAEQQPGFVKHSPIALARRADIAQLYQTAEDGVAFQAGLARYGFRLAQGDRRGVLLVDNATGQEYSLSRQLRGQIRDTAGELVSVRAKDIRARFVELGPENLPTVEALAAARGRPSEVVVAEDIAPAVDPARQFDERMGPETATEPPQDDLEGFVVSESPASEKRLESDSEAIADLLPVTPLPALDSSGDPASSEVRQSAASPDAEQRREQAHPATGGASSGASASRTERPADAVQPPVWDREADEVARQGALSDAAMAAAQQSAKKTPDVPAPPVAQVGTPSPSPANDDVPFDPSTYYAAADEYHAAIERARHHQWQRDLLEAKLAENYATESLKLALTEAQVRLADTDTWLGRRLGRHQAAQEIVEGVQRSLQSAEQRMGEQRQALAVRQAAEVAAAEPARTPDRQPEPANGNQEQQPSLGERDVNDRAPPEPEIGR